MMSETIRSEREVEHFVLCTISLPWVQAMLFIDCSCRCIAVLPTGLFADRHEALSMERDGFSSSQDFGTAHIGEIHAGGLRRTDTCVCMQAHVQVHRPRDNAWCSRSSRHVGSPSSLLSKTECLGSRGTSRETKAACRKRRARKPIKIPRFGL